MGFIDWAKENLATLLIAVVVLGGACFVQFDRPSTSAYQYSTGSAGPSTNFNGFFGPAAASSGYITFLTATVNFTNFNLSNANLSVMNISNNMTSRTLYLTQLGASDNGTYADLYLDSCASINTSNLTQCLVNWTPQFEFIVSNVSPQTIDLIGNPFAIPTGTAARVRLFDNMSTASNVAVNAIIQNITN